MSGLKRIYHSWDNWEDYKAGFYDNVSVKDKKEMIKKAIEMFNSSELTKKYMEKVIKEWFFSCEQNLSNTSMNRVAYIGQAACCLYAGIPNLLTMNAWGLLTEDVRLRSDEIAKKIILKWEQEKILKSISKVGSLRVMKTEYQTKLQLN